jgi:hypothetical protein
MTLHFTNRLATLLAIAAALTALVAPAALARPDAGPDTWYPYAVSQGPSSDSTQAGTTFITDTLAPGGVHSTPAGTTFITDTLAPGPTPVAAQPVGDGGFDWGILAIAVGGAVALLLGLAGGLRLRSQHRPATV